MTDEIDKTNNNDAKLDRLLNLIETMRKQPQKRRKSSMAWPVVAGAVAFVGTMAFFIVWSVLFPGKDGHDYTASDSGEVGLTIFVIALIVGYVTGMVTASRR